MGVHVHQTSTAGEDPQANGLCELMVRMVGLIKLRARTLLIQAKLSLTYWPFALQHANYLLRARALDELVPHDLPIFGIRVVMGRRNRPPDPFETRGKLGRYLGVCPKIVGGAFVLLNDDNTVITAASPKTLANNMPDQGPWTQHVDPEGKGFGVDSKGQSTRKVPSSYLFEEELAQGSLDEVSSAPVARCPACEGKDRAHTYTTGCDKASATAFEAADRPDPDDDLLGSSVALSCPACLGKHRAHPRASGCRLWRFTAVAKVAVGKEVLDQEETL